jgi:hypothetical protein
VGVRDVEGGVVTDDCFPPSGAFGTESSSVMVIMTLLLLVVAAAAVNRGRLYVGRWG